MPTKPEQPAILIVDDEAAALDSTRRVLGSRGFDHVVTCRDGRDVGAIVARQPIALVLLDLRMPDCSGETILAELTERSPEVAVVVVTAESDARPAIRCMKLGAADYLLKPVDPEQLMAVVEKALARAALQFECNRLRDQFFSDELQDRAPFEAIVTADRRMLRLFAYVEAISRAAQPVLILGETGTGKELMARALHAAGRSAGPFVAVNAAGLDQGLFDDALFGHRAGAFTGAAGARRGLVDRASGGTLFLDEIGDLPEALQVKLLRLLQEGEYFPLGSDKPETLRARIVAATHRDPGQLRADLYYRLRTYQVRMPPLRERLADLPLLVDHFLEIAAAELGKAKPSVPTELYAYLENHSFPGNVRELQAMVSDAVARHEQGMVSVRAFLDQIPAGAAPERRRGTDVVFPFPLPTLRELERAAVAEGLRRVQGNQSAVAHMLGVSRPTVGRICKELGDPDP